MKRLGATPLGVWVIKHVAAPIQRFFYRASGGRLFTSTGAGREVLLLTTKGRRTGKDRTIPLYYLRDGHRIILCNVNPGFERVNPWVINLRAHPTAKLQIGAEIVEYQAREATEMEIALYWPQLVRIWPAYQSHFEKSRQRAIFVLERHPNNKAPEP
ncbi:MAG: nitroreductase family deazaflavin-dependent oxidoreductase [Chloroflexi bacterium]|nr:nitroreductase family deazaflavin-dependent oxidoreductase [Chloroflexota bacterium]